MSNDNQEVKSEESATSSKKSTGEVLASVADKIRTSGDEVRDRVIRSMVEKKLSARADIAERALLKLKDSDKELKKLVPDLEQYAEGSDKPVRAYSKERREQRKKAEESKSKLERALETVLSGKDEKGNEATEEHWSKLSEALK